MQKPFIKSSNGFTILGAIVAIIAVVAGFVLVSKLSVSMLSGEKKLDNLVASDQVLALTARSVLDEEFDTFLERCNQVSDSGVKPIDGMATWNCVDAAQKFNPAITADPAKMFLSKVNQKNEADASNDGRFCVELSRCALKAADQILDVTITAVYPEPDPRLAAHRRSMTFRKSKW